MIDRWRPYAVPFAVGLLLVIVVAVLLEQAGVA